MPHKFTSMGKCETNRTNQEKAFNYRVKTKCSIREASDKFSIKSRTLQEAFKRSRAKSDGTTYVPVEGKTFTADQETTLCQYAVTAAKCFTVYHATVSEVSPMNTL
ncbi:hypothetical protein GWK47_048529 [Chionoecetes opilio]|uniref:Uncharacterized protein n=1 Tax=Chionoecetes opilio TaxID=41210 RepID=A0A8J4YFJ6_CHIOP|nr:hypothetical protein GWK47_048529 [Chionoecetes opilio]